MVGGGDLRFFCSIWLFTLHLSCALVVCPSERVIFYHIPRTGGFSMSRTLLDAGRNCTWFGGVLLSGRHTERVDPMHASPLDLEQWSERGLLFPFSDWHQDLDRSPWRLPVADMQGKWDSFAVVRCPYMRILSAFEQRIADSVGTYAAAWGCLGHRDRATRRRRHRPRRRSGSGGGDGGGGSSGQTNSDEQRNNSDEHDDNSPRGSCPRIGFVTFMRWLERGLEEGTHSWCCEPSLVHFRPASRYTHWLDGRRAVTRVIKLESLPQSMPELISTVMRRFHPPDGQPIQLWRAHVRAEAPAARSQLCQSALGCEQHEMGEILSRTAHTIETMQIVNRLYRRDFELHNYTMLAPPTMNTSGEPATQALAALNEKGSPQNNRPIDDLLPQPKEEVLLAQCPRAAAPSVTLQRPTSIEPGANTTITSTATSGYHASVERRRATEERGSTSVQQQSEALEERAWWNQRPRRGDAIGAAPLQSCTYRDANSCSLHPLPAGAFTPTGVPSSTCAFVLSGGGVTMTHFP